ncbi:MAG: FkbM family methyltransferase [Myxococcales bacterium]|nr:FkbM family methyltransferase [Myxococcales bacterium]
MNARRAIASGARSQLALWTARAASRSSRLWRQRGLGTIFLKLQGLRAFRGAECTVEFAPDCFFHLPVFEPYWGPTVIGGRPFEPEVVHLLHAVRELRPVLVDCGANYGYYSVLATGPAYGYAGALAIEANPATYARLRENARLNANRFETQNLALSARSGETVSLSSTEHHAVTHVNVGGAAEDGAGPGAVEVTTVTIPDALAKCGLDTAERYVLKLDVEGQEIAALEGSRAWRDGTDHLIVYEDWADSGFETTAALLAEDYPVFFVRKDGRVHRVTSTDEALRVISLDGKVSRSCNFAATKRGGAFEAKLAGALTHA